MKIAFDIHGTLDKNPDILLPFMETLIYHHHVFIISGPPLIQIEKELEKLDCTFMIHYDSIFSVVDYLKLKGVEMTQDDKGNWWCDEEEWWKSKARICDEYCIDMIFDNEIKYKQWMNENTQFVLWG